MFAIYQPLHKLLEAICPLGFTAEFWTRAAVTVIYLLPLWVVLVFGLPDLRARSNYVPAGRNRAARAGGGVFRAGRNRHRHGLAALRPARRRLTNDDAPVR